MPILCFAALIQNHERVAQRHMYFVDFLKQCMILMQSRKFVASRLFGTSCERIQLIDLTYFLLCVLN